MSELTINGLHNVLGDYMSYAELKEQLWDMFRAYTATTVYTEMTENAKHVATHSFQLNIELIDKLAKAQQ